MGVSVWELTRLGSEASLSVSRTISEGSGSATLSWRWRWWRKNGSNADVRNSGEKKKRMGNMNQEVSSIWMSLSMSVWAKKHVISL